MTDYVHPDDIAEMRAKANAERLARQIHNQAQTIIAMQKTIAKLERKAKKWKRRAKLAEALTYSKANLDAGFAERAKELGYVVPDAQGVMR